MIHLANRMANRASNRAANRKKELKRMKRAQHRARILFISRCIILHVQCSGLNVWFNPRFKRIRDTAYDLINSAAAG